METDTYLTHEKRMYQLKQDFITCHKVLVQKRLLHEAKECHPANDAQTKIPTWEVHVCTAVSVRHCLDVTKKILAMRGALEEN